MRIQVFSRYYNLAQAGVVKPLACPNHEKEKPLVYDLIHFMGNDDKIRLKCLACNYEQIAGIQLYENILKELRNLDAT